MADQSEATDAAIETKEPETTKLDEEAEEAERERLRREREARAQALTLEIVGDLPFAEVKPPENVLFVCKLNPVTEGSAPLPRGHLEVYLKHIHQYR